MKNSTSLFFKIVNSCDLSGGRFQKTPEVEIGVLMWYAWIAIRDVEVIQHRIQEEKLPVIVF